mgnify:CR=1 FL=1
MQTQFSENALRVLQHRYLRRDSTGSVCETPEQLLWRVARSVAEADAEIEPGASVTQLTDVFFRMMAERRFFANSPVLAAGRPRAQLAACFVLPLEDSVESIYEALKHAALIQQTGGGTGFDFSRLRPRGDRIASTGGKTSGPVSFMRLFNASTDVMTQSGIRRGANMAVLRGDHPDVLRFVAEKSDRTRLNFFNVSVGLSDAMMQTVGSGGELATINPHTGAVARRLPAARLFEAIVTNAWDSGEPGVLFLDTINAANPTPQLGRLNATNPCGEQPLLPYESCILGSINVARCVAAQRVDWQALTETVHLAVRFLDDVIEANHYPVSEIERVTKLTRKIGLGVMGFADLLIDLDIPYDSASALQLAETLMAHVHKQARRASAQLAERRGAFPAWHDSALAARGAPPQRNATVTSVAPTGTLSLLAGCSPGIEPLYALSFVRHVLDDQHLQEVQPAVGAALAERGLDAQAVLAEVQKTGSLRAVDGVPEDLQRRFPTARDVPAPHHVRMQAAFQKHVDNAVSKTINFPESARVRDVADAYRLAHELGCKGITVYREGARPQQVLERRPTGPRLQAEPAQCPECTTDVLVAADSGTQLCPECGWMHTEEQHVQS